MIDYETIARNNHRSGMNCASAVYDALGGKNTPPRPRDNGGMCGAVLAAEQAIREAGGSDEDIAEFERQFMEQHKYLKCGDLRGFLSGKCNDYVGTAASIAGKMGIVKK